MAGRALVFAFFSLVISFRISVQSAQLLPKNTQPGYLVPYGSFSTNVPVGIQVIDVATCTNSHVVAIDSALNVIDNETYHTPIPDPDYLNTPDNVKAVSIGAGPDHTIVLQPNSATLGWGRTRYGACLVDQGTNIIAIATALYHSILLRMDGSPVVVTQTGEPPFRSDIKTITAVAAGNHQSVVLQFDGTVAAWGSGLEPNDAITNVPAGLTNVTAIASGDTHAVALKADGTIVLWGSQTYVPAGAPPSRSVATITFSSGAKATSHSKRTKSSMQWPPPMTLSFSSNKIYRASRST
jgi:alpha-tubulin suppressor-like RCC1 family protein